MLCVWAAFAWALFHATYKVDFLGNYIGGLLIHEGKPHQIYDAATVWARERELLPDIPVIRIYVRPPFYALLLSPLTVLPLWPAFLVEMALLYGIIAGSWIWAARRFGPDSLIWSSIFYPAAIGTAYGQDCAIILAAALLCYISIEKEKPLLAGLLLGIALFKFHLILLFPVIFLMYRQWRILAGLTLSTGIAIVLSLAIIGPSGVPGYLRVIQNTNPDVLNPSPQSMLNIYAIPANFFIDSTPLDIALAMLILSLTILAAYRAPLWRWFSAAAAGSLLIAPHCYLYDATFLLLPLWLVIFHSTEKVTRICTLIMAAPFLYFFVGTHPPYTGMPSLLILTFLSGLAFEGFRNSRAKPLPAAFASAVHQLS